MEEGRTKGSRRGVGSRRARIVDGLERKVPSGLELPHLGERRLVRWGNARFHFGEGLDDRVQFPPCLCALGGHFDELLLRCRCTRGKMAPFGQHRERTERVNESCLAVRLVAEIRRSVGAYADDE